MRARDERDRGSVHARPEAHSMANGLLTDRADTAFQSLGDSRGGMARFGKRAQLLELGGGPASKTALLLHGVHSLAYPADTIAGARALPRANDRWLQAPIWSAE